MLSHYIFEFIVVHSADAAIFFCLKSWATGSAAVDMALEPFAYCPAVKEFLLPVDWRNLRAACASKAAGVELRCQFPECCNYLNDLPGVAQRMCNRCLKVVCWWHLDYHQQVRPPRPCVGGRVTRQSVRGTMFKTNYCLACKPKRL